MSLTELSEAVGVSIQNLSVLKTGRARAIRFSTLEALCRVLNCTPGDLLSIEDDAADESDQQKQASILRPAWGRRTGRT